jgi:hypothetical protein
LSKCWLDAPDEHNQPPVLRRTQSSNQTETSRANKPGFNGRKSGVDVLRIRAAFAHT